MRQRLAAIVALVVGAATVVLALAVAIGEFPRGLVLLGCVLIAEKGRLFGVGVEYQTQPAAAMAE